MPQSARSASKPLTQWTLDDILTRPLIGLKDGVYQAAGKVYDAATGTYEQGKIMIKDTGRGLTIAILKGGEWITYPLTKVSRLNRMLRPFGWSKSARSARRRRKQAKQFAKHLSGKRAITASDDRRARAESYLRGSTKWVSPNTKQMADIIQKKRASRGTTRRKRKSCSRCRARHVKCRHRRR